MKTLFFLLIPCLSFADTLVINHYADPSNLNNFIDLVDTDTNTLLTSLPVPQGYGGTAIGITRGSSGHSLAYVVIRNDGYGGYTGLHNVTVVDVETKQITNVITDNLPALPDEIAILPNGTKAYVACYGSNPGVTAGSVAVINLSTNKVVSTVTVGLNPQSIVASPDGTKVFVVNQTSNSVSVINTASDTVSATIAVGTNPFSGVLTPNGQTLYVGNTTSSSISVINTQTLAVVQTIAGVAVVGNNLSALQVSDDGTYLYVSQPTTVTVVNTSTNIAGAPQAVPNGAPASFVPTPSGYVYSSALPGGQHAQAYAYVFLNGVYQQVLGPPQIGLGTTFGCATTDGSKVYLANYYTPSLTVISATNPSGATQVVTSGLTLGLNAIASAPASSNVIGKAKKNQFFVQKELYNQISWSLPVGATPRGYSIYRNAALTDLVANVASNVFTYLDRGLHNNATYSYYITYTDSYGNQNALGSCSVVQK